MLMTAGPLTETGLTRCLSARLSSTKPHPFYDLVPKDPLENVKFRVSLLELAKKDRGWRKILKECCSRDELFYVNSFCWTHSPKDSPDDPLLPFITWPYQDKTLTEFQTATKNKYDVLVEKSRDMGVTWMVALHDQWDVNFHELRSIKWASRKKEYVDLKGDPDCLMWKLDFLNRTIPAWLRPAARRIDMLYENEQSGSVIAGESTNDNIGRGGRRTRIFLDEFATFEHGHAVLSSVHDATNTVVYVSTPQGKGNAFYAERERITNTKQGKVIRLHWSLHPLKAKDLYIGQKGEYRSSWYDAQCLRRHPVEVAQELDIDYAGSDYGFFEADVLDRCAADYCREPLVRGEIIYEGDRCEPRGFREMSDGQLLLWIRPDDKGRLISPHSFVLGVDISTGKGSSNSVISVVSRKTGEKVAEYATKIMPPEDFARLAVALARWFRGPRDGAQIIWEANGPGRAFGDKVMELGYSNVYFKRQEQKITKDVSEIPGWWSVRETKRLLLEHYRAALKEGKFLNRSRWAIDECREYVFRIGEQMVEHARSASSLDPHGAGENHGDRVIADALAWWLLKDEQARPHEETRLVPARSYAARNEYWDLMKAQDDLW